MKQGNGLCHEGPGPVSKAQCVVCGRPLLALSEIRVTPARFRKTRGGSATQQPSKTRLPVPANLSAWPASPPSGFLVVAGLRPQIPNTTWKTHKMVSAATQIATRMIGVDRFMVTICWAGGCQDFLASGRPITAVTARCVAAINWAMASPLSFGKATNVARIATRARATSKSCGTARIG
jgi:hypothetical protein